MLTAEEVESLILCRVLAASSSCNSHHINHCLGQIRALVAVLTGERPPVFNTIPETMDAAGIPYELYEGGKVGWIEEWLLEHGFLIEHGENPEDDEITHPKFSAW